ncbi:MAG: hypothetical protein RID25_22900 [Cyclobacteriaceae bacterium]
MMIPITLGLTLLNLILKLTIGFRHMKPLILLLFIFLITSSCYEPEEYMPPVYLDPEVSLVVDNVSWDSVKAPGITLNFNNNRFYLGMTNETLSSGFLCTIQVKDRDSVMLFHDYSGDRTKIPIKSGSYRSSDTVSVIMMYQLRGVGDNSDGHPDYDYWSASDPEFNVLTIEEVFIDDLELYVSGSFEARAEHSTDKQFPRYRFIEGTFKNVRVTKTYFRSQ